LCYFLVVFSAYGLFVLANVIPLDISITNRINANKKISENPAAKAIVRLQEKETNIKEWNTRWAQADKGSWTRKLIKDNEARGNLKYFPSFYTTQLLTDHGNLKEYLKRMKPTRSNNCQLCNSWCQNAEHIIIDCMKLADLRIEHNISNLQDIFKESFQDYAEAAMIKLKQ